MLDWLVAEFSDPRNAVAQCIGFIPLILSFFTFLSAKRRRIFAVKTATDLLWALHFFLLGEYVGGAINAVNTVRNVVFSQKGKKKWASHTAVFVLFCILIAAAALIRWKDWYSILPMLGSLLAATGFWCSSPRNIRKFNLPALSLWLIYGIIVGSISTVLCNLLSLTSLFIAEIKDRKDKKAPDNL